MSWTTNNRGIAPRLWERHRIDHLLSPRCRKCWAAVDGLQARAAEVVAALQQCINFEQPNVVAEARKVARDAIRAGKAIPEGGATLSALEERAHRLRVELDALRDVTAERVAQLHEALVDDQPPLFERALEAANRVITDPACVAGFDPGATLRRDERRPR